MGIMYFFHFAFFSFWHVFQKAATAFMKTTTPLHFVVIKGIEVCGGGYKIDVQNIL
jgi:hypothetical protein